jgi:hypothetical protein
MKINPGSHVIVAIMPPTTKPPRPNIDKTKGPNKNNIPIINKIIPKTFNALMIKNL